MIACLLIASSSRILYRIWPAYRSQQANLATCSHMLCHNYLCVQSNESDLRRPEAKLRRGGAGGRCISTLLCQREWTRRDFVFW